MSNASRFAGGLVSAAARTLFRPGAAESLAVLRILTGGVTILVVWLVDPAPFAELPDELRVPLLGSEPLFDLVPPSDALVRALSWALFASAFALMIGFKTRASAIATAILTVYVLGVPQLFGKVDHYHHLVWFAVLLAIAPSGDALAVDARGRRADRSAVYGFPMTIAWLLVGMLYLFPGLGKLQSAGLRWALSDNLRNIAWSKAWEDGWTPIIDLTGRPLLYKGAALGILLLEIGFICCVVHRRLRLLAIAGAVTFHVLSFLTVHIFFWSLVVLYLAFADWGRLLRRSAPTDERRPGAVALVASAVLLFLVALPGIGVIAPKLQPEVKAWPFAAYPIFGGVREAEQSTIDVVPVVDGAEGDPLEAGDIFGDWMPSHRYHGMIDEILRSSERDAKLAAFARELGQRGRVTGVDSIRFYRTVVSTAPETRGQAIAPRTLLLEETL